MHNKAIRHEVRTQLKNEYPNWHRLTRKEKKSITNKVIEEVLSDYEYKSPIKASSVELLGIETQTFSLEL